MYSANNLPNPADVAGLLGESATCLEDVLRKMPVRDSGKLWRERSQDQVAKTDRFSGSSQKHGFWDDGFPPLCEEYLL
jgi:hypothetical protein